MKKASNKSRTTHAHSLQDGKVLGDGWRIKERKVNRPTDSARRDVDPLRAKPEDASEQTVCVSGHNNAPQHRRWCHPIGVFASLCAAVAVMMMVVNVPSSWLGSSSVSQPANAESHTLSPSARGQKTTAQQVMADDGYQLHLGAYRSETGARLVWAGLEADSGTLLDDLDPLFKSQQMNGEILYHVLAGTYARRGVADGHCAWLKNHKIDCSVVGG